MDDVQKELLEQIQKLEQSNSELLQRCNLYGTQIAQIKEMYVSILAEVKILKEGGNF